MTGPAPEYPAAAAGIAVNLSLVFAGMTLPNAIVHAAGIGVRDVEFHWPSRAALDGWSLSRLGRTIHDSRLGVVLLNLPAGDLINGERGLASDPGRLEEFREGAELGLNFAREVGCPTVNALAGNLASGTTRDVARRTLIDNLRFVADGAAERNIGIVIEALNRTDSPRYLLPTADDVVQIIDDVRRSNVRVQLDTYHAAMEGIDPVRVVRDLGDRIGHVQLADWPGRHEPGTGRLDFTSLRAALGEVGYSGRLSFEFVPAAAGIPDFNGAALALGFKPSQVATS